MGLAVLIEGLLCHCTLSSHPPHKSCGVILARQHLRFPASSQLFTFPNGQLSLCRAGAWPTVQVCQPKP